MMVHSIAIAGLLVLCVGLLYIIVSLSSDFIALRKELDELRMRLNDNYYTKQAVSRMVAGSPVDRPHSSEHDNALDESLKLNTTSGHPSLPVVEHITGEPIVTKEKK